MNVISRKISRFNSAYFFGAVHHKSHAFYYLFINEFKRIGMKIHTIYCLNSLSEMFSFDSLKSLIEIKYFLKSLVLGKQDKNYFVLNFRIFTKKMIHGIVVLENERYENKKENKNDTSG